MSPGLLRARAPYRFKNAITGITIFGFCVGVWAYSISAVKQENFDDIDEEAKALVAASQRTPEEQNRQAFAAATSTISPSAASPPSSNMQDAWDKNGASPHGLLVGVLRPSLLDPHRKTLVWGAPSVDNVGKLGNSSHWEPNRS